MTGRPLFDNIIVELLEEKEEVSEGGILLVKSLDGKGDDTKLDHPAYGKVVATGNGLPDLTSGELKYYPMDVKKGDVVAFRDVDGFSMMHNGRPSVLLNLKDILYVEEN